MFKLTQLTSAMLIAFASQALHAQENSATQQTENDGVEVIEVSGIRGSLDKAMNIKRQEIQVVDAIVAEDIGKFPDNNVVEALQRVTGVQVTDRGAGEVNTVTIRGLTDVTTTINGRSIFTASGRSVALADIPASLLKDVTVYKTRSASQLESGLGGQININTQRPFDFEGSKVVLAARGIYSDQPDEIDPNVSALLSNRWELDGGKEFGALLNVSYNEIHYRDQSVAPGAFVPFMTANPADGFVPFERIQSEDVRVSESPIWQGGLEHGLPNTAGSTLSINGEETEYLLSRDAIFANDLNGLRKRPAVNLSLQFAPNNTSEYTFEAFYNGYRDTSFNSLLFSFVDWWDENASDPILYEGTNVAKERTVFNIYGFNSGDLTESKTDSYVYALGGKWDLSDNLQLQSEVVYQQSKYETDFVALRTERVAYGLDVDFNDNDGLPSMVFLDNPVTDIDETDLTNPALWNTAQMYDSGSSREGDALTFTVDGNYFTNIDWMDKVTFGVRVENRAASEASRDTNGYVNQPLVGLDEGLRHITSDFFDGRANVPSNWVVANGYYVRDNRQEFRDMYGFAANKLQLQKTFEIDETKASLYFQGNYTFDLGGKVLDGQIGFRYTKTETDMDFFETDGTQSSDSVSHSKFLPTLTVRYHLTDDVIARFAYTETFGLPAFTSLNPNIIYTPTVTNADSSAVGGNPNLDPTESKNYDLTLEWYFAPSSSVYGTLFRRDIEGFVYDSLSRTTHLDDDGVTRNYIVSQPDNTSNGVLEGMELGLVYFPENLPEVLDGMGIQASYTMLDSSQDLPEYDNGILVGYTTRDMFGVSDSSYSAVLIYEKENFDARLSYVWRDDFLNSNEAATFANPRGVYRRPETSLDFQMSYDVTENLMVTFDATNLTDEIYQSYYEDAELYNLGNSIFSRTFALGARYSF